MTNITKYELFFYKEVKEALIKNGVDPKSEIFPELACKYVFEMMEVFLNDKEKFKNYMLGIKQRYN